jgi:hypothetical protein
MTPNILTYLYTIEISELFQRGKGIFYDVWAVDVK